VTSTLGFILGPWLAILVAGIVVAALCVLLPMGVIAALRLVESLAAWSVERTLAAAALVTGALRSQGRFGVRPLERRPRWRRT
jgi:hypothetical protein